MKHFFTFLFILLGLCASTSVLAYDFEVDGLLYLKVWGSDTEVEVTCDYRNPYTMSVINIPSSVVYEGKTYKVTEINRINEGDDNDYIKEIIIPESVTLIKGAAFSKCTALTSIVIPDNVTEAHGRIFEVVAA
ncbi:MAG: leucine-rich repeat protein [Bacteroidaceae bacterium]|nr:leucine-rich repeat protein [Bacteroidaceae bacterium]